LHCRQLDIGHLGNPTQIAKRMEIITSHGRHRGEQRASAQYTRDREFHDVLQKVKGSTAAFLQ
jgi:hypothetical protein